MAQRRDYREDRLNKDWWSVRIWWLGGITRDNLMWLIVGIFIAVLYFKFPVNLRSGVYGPW